MPRSIKYITTFAAFVLTLSGCDNLNNYRYSASAEERTYFQWRAKEVAPPPSFTDQLISAAQARLGQNERTHRVALREFMGVDPRRTEWCAAYLNAVLRSIGGKGTEEVTAYPLLAQSFLEIGRPVPKARVQEGDIVILRRGSEIWQGHVGIFMGTEVDSQGRTRWLILGGNQNNTVSIQPYWPSRVIGIRRLEDEPVSRSIPA